MGKIFHKDLTGADLHVNKAHTHPGGEITTAVNDSDHLKGSTKAQVQDHAPKAHKTSHHLGQSDEVNHDQLKNMLANEHIDWTNATENFYTTGTGRFGDTLAVGTNLLPNQILRADKTISTHPTASGIHGGVCNSKGTMPASAYGLHFDARGIPAGQSEPITYSTLGGALVGVTMNSTSYMHTLSADRIFAISGTLGVAKSTPLPVVVTRAEIFWAKNPRIMGGATMTTLYAFYDEGMTAGATDWGFYGLSAQNYLSGTLQTGGYISQDGSAGVSGSFITADVPAKTITVKNGIITSIV